MFLIKIKTESEGLQNAFRYEQNLLSLQIGISSDPCKRNGNFNGGEHIAGVIMDYEVSYRRENILVATDWYWGLKSMCRALKQTTLGGELGNARMLLSGNLN